MVCRVLLSHRRRLVAYIGGDERRELRGRRRLRLFGGHPFRGHAFIVSACFNVNAARGEKVVNRMRCVDNHGKDGGRKNLFMIPRSTGIVFNGFKQQPHLVQGFVVRQLMEHETQPIQAAFVSIQDMGVSRRCLNGQRWLVGEESRQHHQRPSAHEREAIERWNHQSIADPNHRHPQDDDPRRCEVGGMKFHGVDGAQANFNGRMPLSLNGQHPLIQGDVNPF